MWMYFRTNVSWDVERDQYHCAAYVKAFIIVKSQFLFRFFFFFPNRSSEGTTPTIWDPLPHSSTDSSPRTRPFRGILSRPREPYTSKDRYPQILIPFPCEPWIRLHLHPQEHITRRIHSAFIPGRSTSDKTAAPSRQNQLVGSSRQNQLVNHDTIS